MLIDVGRLNLIVVERLRNFEIIGKVINQANFASTGNDIQLEITYTVL